MWSAEDIREHLIVTLNSMFKRPGMYGGWLAAHIVIDMLEYVDGVDEGRISVVDSNARTPERFVDERLPDPRGDIYHSLFLPRLHRRGWFRPDRLLTTVAAWAAEHLFPVGLNLTTRGKELIADRRPVAG